MAVVRQAAEPARLVSARELASNRFMPLLLSCWPEVEEELLLPLNNCEAVIWRWKIRGPVLVATGEADEAAVDGALMFSAFVLNCRWNMELVYLD